MSGIYNFRVRESGQKIIQNCNSCICIASFKFDLWNVLFYRNLRHTVRKKPLLMLSPLTRTLRWQGVHYSDQFTNWIIHNAYTLRYLPRFSCKNAVARLVVLSAFQLLEDSPPRGKCIRSLYAITHAVSRVYIFFSLHWIASSNTLFLFASTVDCARDTNTLVDDLLITYSAVAFFNWLVSFIVS